VANLRGEERARYVADMFGRISTKYDLLNTVMSGGRHYAWRRKTVSMAVGYVSGEALDVATGTGDFLFDLLSRGAVTRAIGVDFTPEMLDIARQKALDRGLSDKIELVTGDAHRLPFDDERFICVTVGFGVRNFVDLPKAIAEMWRVLKPGGRLAILEIVKSDSSGPWSKLTAIGFRWAAPLIGSALAGNRDAYTYLPESVEGFLSARELAGLMRSAGFRYVSYRKLGMGTVAILLGTKV